MLKKKELVIAILAVVMLVLSITTVFAADGVADGDILNQLLRNESDIANENPDDYNEIENGATNNIIDNSTNNTVNNSANNNTPDKLANTGIGDYSSIVIIAVAGISAIYAYKKIREYNV